MKNPTNATMQNEENLLNRLKMRQMYVEERVRNEGVAIVSLPDGSRDFYDLQGKHVRHCGKVEAKSTVFQSDDELGLDNPWVYCEDEVDSCSDRNERPPRRSDDLPQPQQRDGLNATEADQRISAFRPVKSSMLLSSFPLHQSAGVNSVETLEVTGSVDLNFGAGYQSKVKLASVRVLQYKDM